MCLAKLTVGLTLCAAIATAHAAVTVGTCNSPRNPYPTIAAGIAAAKPYGIVEVCPGTYAEQVTITKPLTLIGLVLPNQPGVTLMPPAAGMLPIPNSDNGVFTEVYAANAGGPVNLSNLTIEDGGTLLLPNYSIPVGGACDGGLLTNIAAVIYSNTPGVMDHLNVPAVNASGAPPGTTLTYEAGCGTGIEVDNEDSMVTVVRESVVTNAGHQGIKLSGKSLADHNMVAPANHFHSPSPAQPVKLPTIPSQELLAHSVHPMTGQPASPAAASPKATSSRASRLESRECRASSATSSSTTSPASSVTAPHST